MRVINANEAVKAIIHVRDNELHHGYPRSHELYAIRKALRCIEETPTIDAVPVVRCKSCQYWQKSIMGITDYGFCCLMQKTMWYNSYCSEGR